MSSDFLSQDVIDALLGADLSGDSASVNGEVATDIINAYNEHVKSVANLNLGREVSIEIDYVDNARPSIIAEKIEGEYLLLDVPYSEGCQGNMRVIASKASFGAIADLMVGGDGSTPYSDESKDAITELFSQISGAFSTELGGKVGASVNADTPAILDNEGCEVLEGDFTAFCKLSIDGIEPIDILISPDEMLLESLSPPKPEQQDSDSDSDSADLPSAPVAAASSGATASAAAAQPAGASVSMPENSFSAKAPKVNVDMLLDIELEVTIELGRSNVAIKKVLDLAPGSLVELDRFAGEPVDLLVNNKVVAKGEVVVIDENFGVRIISLVSPEERIRSLK